MYTNTEQVRKLKLLDAYWSLDMVKAYLRSHIQERRRARHDRAFQG